MLPIRSSGLDNELLKTCFAQGKVWYCRRIFTKEDSMIERVLEGKREQIRKTRVRLSNQQQLVQLQRK